MQMKNIQMRTTPLLFSLHFSRFVLFFSYGARNTSNRRTTPPDSMALFVPLLPKSRLFLTAVFCYTCIFSMPGVPDMSKASA